MNLHSLDDELATYRLVHQILGSPLPGEVDERRQKRRRPLATVQAIALCDGDAVPPPEAFVPVQCHDLSERGFSFVFPEPPQFARLVAALNDGRHTYHLACEVAHSTPARVDDLGLVEPLHRQSCRRRDDNEAARHNSRLTYLVGCRFLRRID